MNNGVLLVDKPAGPTSHDVVGSIRKLFSQRRVGHAGTLDPFATGLLVVLIGSGTKLSSLLIDHDKQYRAEVSWGSRTDTGDHTGQVVQESDIPVPPEGEIREAMAGFLGQSMQKPPMYSAKKVDGKRLFKRARKGQVVERDPVEIRIDRIELIEILDQGFTFEVKCAKGTYVRVLAEDLAATLGGCAHLSGLRRLASGFFRIEEADPLAELINAGKQKAISRLIPIEKACEGFPAVVLASKPADRLRFGQMPKISDFIRSDPFAPAAPIRFLDQDGRLLALAEALDQAEKLPDLELAGEKTFRIHYNFAANSR
jgi:tRNA pseudouridine55 synthase